jgi:hypothetical protein
MHLMYFVSFDWILNCGARSARSAPAPAPRRRPRCTCCSAPTAPLPPIRTLLPAEFVGMPVTRLVGDDLKQGIAAGYDAHRPRWRVGFHGGATTAFFTASDTCRRTDPHAQCARPTPQPGSSTQAISEYLLHRPPASPASCVADAAPSPHQRCHWAKVVTARQPVALRCTGGSRKYTNKHGDAARQLCNCKGGCRARNYWALPL